MMANIGKDMQNVHIEIYICIISVAKMGKLKIIALLDYTGT